MGCDLEEIQLHRLDGRRPPFVFLETAEDWRRGHFYSCTISGNTRKVHGSCGVGFDCMMDERDIRRRPARLLLLLERLAALRQKLRAIESPRYRES